MRLPVFRRVVALGVFALLVVGCDELTSTDKRLTKDVSRKISLVFKGLESREYGRSPLIGGDSPEFFVLLPLVGQHPDLPSGDDCTTSGDVQTCGNDTVTFETRSTYQTNDDPSTGFRLEGTRKITLASDPPITQIDSFTEHFTASGANWRIESKHDVALSTSGKRRFRLEWDAREIREQFDADNPDTFVRDVSIEKGSTLTYTDSTGTYRLAVTSDGLQAKLGPDCPTSFERGWLRFTDSAGNNLRVSHTCAEMTTTYNGKDL